MRLFTWLAVCLLLFGSCATTKLEIEVLHPPQSGLVKPPQPMALFNNIDSEFALTEFYRNGTFIEQINAQNNYIQHYTLVGISKAFKEVNYYTPQIADSFKVNPLSRMKSGSLPKKALDAIFDKIEADLVLVLEGYDASIDANGQVTYSAPVDMSYGTVRVPYFDGSQTVSMTIFFRIYNRNGEVLSQSQVSDQLTSMASGESPQEVHFNMPDEASMLEQTALFVGSNIAKMVSLHWRDVQRTMYLYGNDELVEAGNLAIKGDWPQATDLWFELAGSDREKIAEKASYNMALASEMAGDLDLAITWAERCIENYDSRLAKSYLEVLKQRSKDLEPFKPYLSSKN
jgi:hypothetical protein